eukprot:6457524-Prymnesium_polylepis.1
MSRSKPFQAHLFLSRAKPFHVKPPLWNAPAVWTDRVTGGWTCATTSRAFGLSCKANTVVAQSSGVLLQMAKLRLCVCNGPTGRGTRTGH